MHQEKGKSSTASHSLKRENLRKTQTSHQIITALFSWHVGKIPNKQGYKHRYIPANNIFKIDGQTLRRVTSSLWKLSISRLLSDKTGHKIYQDRNQYQNQIFNSLIQILIRITYICKNIIKANNRNKSQNLRFHGFLKRKPKTCKGIHKVKFDKNKPSHKKIYN